MPCRNICPRYKATKPAKGGRYQAGQIRCQHCAIFIWWDGLYCPCCQRKLRTKPRKLKAKQKLRKEAIIVRVN